MPTASPTDAPTASPTGGPTASPTDAPTASPTDAPTASPTDAPKATTASPTGGPTASPTEEPTGSPIDKFGDDDDTDDKYFPPPVGPEPCPDDILLIKHVGNKEYPHEAVKIIKQDEDSVTVQVNQAFSEFSIDHLYYQYYQNYFNNKCYEEQEFKLEEPVEFVIQCTKNSQIALLELWIADDIDKGVLSDGDNAEIPDCCHSTVPPNTPVTKYMIEIKCETSCPEVTY